MTKIVNLIDLRDALANDVLVDTVKHLDIDTLCTLRFELLNVDIDPINKRILNCLDDEFEYRCLNEFIPENDSDFLSREFDLKMDDESHNDIRKSIELLVSLEIPISIIKWIPALLFVDKAFTVYAYLKKMNRTQVEIDKVFLSSFDTFMKISERTRMKMEYDVYYDEFIQYISYLSQVVSSKKSVTESYQKYTLDVLNKNQELLRRLS